MRCALYTAEHFYESRATCCTSVHGAPAAASLKFNDGAENIHSRRELEETNGLH